jgi:hypothetical protein
VPKQLKDLRIGREVDLRIGKKVSQSTANVHEAGAVSTEDVTCMTIATAPR